MQEAAAILGSQNRTQGRCDLIIRRPGDRLDPAHVGGYEAGVPHQRRGEGPAAGDRGHRSFVSVLQIFLMCLNIFQCGRSPSRT